MKECIHTGLKLYESAKVSHSCHLTCNNISYCILAVGILPGICILKFQAECNLITGNLFNKGLYLISYLEYLLGIFDTSPGHFGNMKETICTSDVDKCAKVCYILNNAFYYIPNVDAFKKLLLQFCLLCN